jgi:hypothetical protein
MIEGGKLGESQSVISPAPQSFPSHKSTPVARTGTGLRSANLRSRVKQLLLATLLILSTVSPVLAEWSATTVGQLFYTDDVALFSATRRSGLDGDHSQPVLDTSETGKGKDMVFEPTLRVMKYIPSSWGETAFTARVRGFVYAVNPEFSQTSVQLEAVHAFTPQTAIRLRYYTTPSQLLGKVEEHRSGHHEHVNERLTSHIGTIRFDQHLSDHWEVQLLGRAGIRRYNEAFAQRDTFLWTIGPHLVWHMTHHAKMVLGYHYERGLAEGRHQEQFEDDTSYVHHFASVGLEVDLMEHLELELDFHYERNNWKSGMPGDERFGGHENVYLGSGRLLYQVADNASLMLTVQRSNRQQNFHQTHDHNTNVSLGVLYRF